MRLWFKKALEALMLKPGWKDAVILSVFAVAITGQPYLFHQKINLFELGIYLPGIDALFQGLVPYRDFFYLRGPFELYAPAFLMRLLGEHLAVLSVYFYAGTVVTLIVYLLISCRILPSRLFLYCLALVFVARTFPRVVFSYWGGMRYGWGALAVFCLILFFIKQHKRWFFCAGVLTAIAGLTSIEIGISVLVAAAAGILFFLQRRVKPVLAYLSGFAVIALPYFVYLLSSGALADYLNAQWCVATQMMKTFLQTDPAPSNIGQFLWAMINMGGKNFRQITPFYCYVGFAGYLFYRKRKGKIDSLDYSVAVLSVYGLMLYFTAFRTLWQSVFEMALQPQKIILFYLLTRVIMQITAKGNLKKTGYFLILAVFISSLGYSLPRFSKRFFVFWKDPLRKQETSAVNFTRVKAMVIPMWQAEDIEQLKKFVDEHTVKNETIWMYPELGALHFILERNWVGKFSTATFAWIDDSWYQVYMEELRQKSPRYAIFERESALHFAGPGFSLQAKRKFKEQVAYLEKNYSIILSTPTYDIYARKNVSK